MNAALKGILAKLTGFWKGMKNRTKVLLIAGSLGAILLAVILYSVITATQYELIYSGLSDTESGQIVSELQTKGVSYKVSGNSIYVDKSKADETRMSLAVDGYPSSSLNYSVYLSNNSWASTDSDKQRLALYQLQNRLQDTINTIPGVKGSVVTITQGNDSSYVLQSDKTKSTASVKLTLATGTTLSSKQVNGIVQLVSHSVSDLSSDDVAVLDSDGNVLTQDGTAGSGDTTEQLQLKAQVENEIKQKVLAVLNPIYGSGNVEVSAGATLDFSNTTTNTTTYSTPVSGSSTGLPSSASSSVTYNTGGSSTASGVAGVNSGQPAYTNSSSGSSTGTIATQTGNATYLYNTVTQQIQSEGGSVKNLTVAVVMNSKNSAIANVNVADVQQTVAHAVGLADSSGVSVQLTPFATGASGSSAANTTKAAGSASAVNMLMLAGTGALLIAVLVGLLLFLLLSGRRKRKIRRLAAEEAGEAPELVIPGAEPGVIPSAAPVPSIEETIEKTSQNGVKRQIEDFADKKPELVAQLLKNWLKD